MFSKKLLSLVLLSSALVTAPLISSFNTHTNKVSAVTCTRNEGAFLYNGDEIEVNSKYIEDDSLSAKIIDNSVTPESQYYNIRFSTARNAYASFKYTSVKLVVEDDEFVDPGAAVSEDERQTFKAYVHSIKGQSKYTDVIIPKIVNFLDHFNLEVVGIHNNAIKQGGYKNITSIIIPDSVTQIEHEAFVNVPEAVSFKFVASEPGHFADNWYTVDPKATKDPEITYNYELDEKQLGRYLNVDYANRSELSNGGKYILGYYDKTVKERYLPLVINYNVTQKDGSIVNRNTIFNLTSKNNPYDAVGKPIGSESISLHVSIPLNPDEVVDDNSLIIENMSIPYNDPEDGYVPDLSLGTFKVNVSPNGRKLLLNEFITIKPLRVSNYGGYTEVDVNMDTVPGIYKVLKPSVYEEFEEKINSGLCVERYRITGLTDALYRLTYKVGDEVKETDLNVGSPFTYYNLPNKTNNVVGFLFEDRLVSSDFHFENLIMFNLVNFNITVDLFSNETHDIVNSKASVNTPFGSTYLLNKEVNPVSTINLLTLLTIVIIVGICLYLAASVGLFFYYKNKFKNDEFRRLKPKQFLKKSIIYFVGYAFIVLAVTYIIFRWGIMHTSIVVFNPLDVFVIIFSIGALISIGLFIRELVLAVRSNKKRKETIKLKLDQDVVDDGTL